MEVQAPQNTMRKNCAWPFPLVESGSKSEKHYDLFWRTVRDAQSPINLQQQSDAQSVMCNDRHDSGHYIDKSLACYNFVSHFDMIPFMWSIFISMAWQQYASLALSVGDVRELMSYFPLLRQQAVDGHQVDHLKR